MFQSNRKFCLPFFAAVLIAGNGAIAVGQVNQPFQPESTPPDPGYTQPPDGIIPPGGIFDPTTPSWLLPGGTPPTARDIAARQRELLLEQQALLEPSITVGGRIMVDAAAFQQDPANMRHYGDIENGCGIRRARIHVRGEAFQVIDYKLEMGFANWRPLVDFEDGFRTVGPQTQFTVSAIQTTAFKDAYFTINELPYIGHLQIGRFKEPFSLSKLASSRFITFMERSPAGASFAPPRSLGIMAFDYSENERFTWAVGLFRSEIEADPPIRSGDNGGVALTARATYLPWYDEATEGRGLFHLGIGYSYRDVDDGTAMFRSTPESLLARTAIDPGVEALGFIGTDFAYIVNTGSIDDSVNWQLLGLEVAWVYGPLSIQAEYMGAFVERGFDPDPAFQSAPDFHGGYVQMSYFLTGEHRPYNRAEAKFGRVVPFENFFRVRTEDGDVVTGMGAWELAYRFSYIDMNFYDEDETVPADRFKGGRSVNHTFGVNWYLNPFTRMMFNYVLLSAEPNVPTAHSNLHVFQARAQIDF